MYRSVKGDYKKRRRPGIIAVATYLTSIILAVVTSYVLASASNLDRQGERPLEALQVNKISSPPGFADADCWQAATVVKETNYLGADLLSHRFSAAWCARDGGIVYRADRTEVLFEADGVRSEKPDNLAYQAESAVDSLEETSITLARSVRSTTTLVGYGFERCVRLTLDARGQAEGSLTCQIS